ncbi:MAG: molybdenum cofactor guanylyltransferase [Cyanobacteriota bacterium]|nr:molybdenum cofactor guanylyltransferase [Cyanobacteriota bacterium]
MPPGPQPLPPGPLPLRCCLLSGGASRRMGRDKALLPHPEGGTWLERQLRLLAELGAPLSLLSGWPTHLERSAALASPLAARGVALELLLEPGGGQGPLVALGHVMNLHPGERLLLCPVDMPALTPSSLAALAEAAAAAPGAIWIATTDQIPARPQPLLGLYPSDAHHHQSLRDALARGERALRRWLAGERVHTLPLPAAALANVNTPEELNRWQGDFKPRPDWSATRCSPCSPQSRRWFPRSRRCRC